MAAGISRPPFGGWNRSAVVAGCAVAVVAFSARLIMVYLRGGSLKDSPSYDTGVYYAAADALVHGRLPYRDFTLVHPPGVMLALAPFAALGRLATDHVGFEAACLGWMGIGALNAVLVLAIARRYGFGRLAALVGALTYALWFESLRTEYAPRLEPLGNGLVLLGLLGLTSFERRGRSSWVAVSAGAALGAAASVKIWYAVPLVVALAWTAKQAASRRAAARAAAGAIAALVLLNGPFFVVAPGRMWRMVVADQVGRPPSSRNPLRRLASIASGGQTTAHTSTTVLAVIVLVAGLAFVALCRLGWHHRLGQLACLLLGTQLVILLAAPTFFLYYADYLTPGLALVTASAAQQLVGDTCPGRPRLFSRPALVALAPAAAAAIMTALIDAINPLHAVSPAPDHNLQVAAASAHCVQSDSPLALIQLDALSRDLSHGCPNWVDVIGKTYEPPLLPTGTYRGRPVTRAAYPPWQRAVADYLTAGDLLLVFDPSAAGISQDTVRTLESGAVIASADGYALHETP